MPLCKTWAPDSLTGIRTVITWVPLAEVSHHHSFDIPNVYAQVHVAWLRQMYPQHADKVEIALLNAMAEHSRCLAITKRADGEIDEKLCEGPWADSPEKAYESLLYMLEERTAQEQGYEVQDKESFVGELKECYQKAQEMNQAGSNATSSTK